MLQLGNATSAALGLPAEATIGQFFEHVRASGYDMLHGLLSTEEAKLAAEQSFAERGQYVLRIVDQLSIPQLRYCSVTFADHATPVRLGLLPDLATGLVEAPFPTELEHLVLWAMLDPLHPLHSEWPQKPGGPVSAWQTLLSGQAVVAIPTNMVGETLRVVCAMFGLAHPDIAQPPPVSSLMDSATHVTVGMKPEGISLVQARLLREAWTAKHPKWRFLSLYRILENAYLATIKNFLLRAFDQDASKAVKDAQAKLASEVNQLVALAEECDLGAELNAFNAAYEALLNKGNTYITMVDRGAEGEALYKSPEIYKKAVIRLYKLRCSIAHAGTSSVIYEQFVDADAATADLAPLIEGLAVKSMKITL